MILGVSPVTQRKGKTRQFLSRHSSSSSMPYMLLSTLLPQLIACLLQTYWFWAVPLSLSWILAQDSWGSAWQGWVRPLSANSDGSGSTAVQVFFFVFSFVWGGRDIHYTKQRSLSLLLKSAQALCYPQQQPLCKLQMVHQPLLCL